MAKLTRLGPPLAIALLLGPILFGLGGTLLPAFGYLPALGGAEFTFSHLVTLLAQPGLFSSSLVSVASGLTTGAISLAVVALFVAAWSGTRTFSRVQHMISPLLSVPHAAAAFGLAFLIAPSGMIARMISPEFTGWQRPPDLLIVNDPFGLSMMAGLIVKEIPFLLLITLAALPQVDVAHTRAITASLGYGRISGFLFSLWPAIYRQIRFAVFAVIAFSASVVDVAIILGPTSPPPLAVRLLEWMRDPDLSMRFLGSAGAILQLLLVVIALLIWIAFERAGAYFRNHLSAAGLRLHRDGWLRGISLGAMLAAAITTLGGLAVLVLWSFAGLWQFPAALPSSLTLKGWMQVAPSVGGPIQTTLIVAALSTGAAVLLSILCLVREGETRRTGGRWAYFVLYLPLIVPQVAFLFGLQFLFVLMDQVASMSALVFVHLIFVMPYVFLSLSDPWRAYDRRYEAISAGLGKSHGTTLFRVRLPMLTRAILTAAAVGFAVSIGLFLPTVLIGAGRLNTITTEAVALASGGNRRLIGVYAFLQMVLPAAGFLVATLLPALIFRHRRAMRA
ncbi:MAG: ABC transporter permease [Mesorhizobium sp.]